MKKLIGNLFVKREANGKFSLYNGKKQISEPKYSSVTCYGNYIVANVNEYEVLIDEYGKELVPDNVYTYIGGCQKGRRICEANNKKAVMINAKPVSEWFDNIRLEIGFNVCTLGSEVFLTTANGQERISESYMHIGMFQWAEVLKRSFAKVKGFNKSVGILDSNGKLCIPCEYEELNKLNQLMYVFKKKSEDGFRYGIIGVNGEKITHGEFDDYETEGKNIKLHDINGEWISYDSYGQRVS